MKDQAESLIRQGQMVEGLKCLKQAIRQDPARTDLRIFLFQVLCLQGDWEGAGNQLNVLGDLDAEHLFLVQMMRSAIQCERLRQEVFQGKRTPLVFGEPPEWLGWLIQANQVLGSGDWNAAADLRDRAFDQAPAVKGSLNGEPFDWIADSDPRLGPAWEWIVDGKYYWGSPEAVRRIEVEAPVDLRDLIWLPAMFTWTNGGKAPGYLPVRYSGTERCSDGLLLLGRKTEWEEKGRDYFLGKGQRLLTTSTREFGILEIRDLTFGNEALE